jgi:hypothetical protein
MKIYQIQCSASKHKQKLRLAADTPQFLRDYRPFLRGAFFSAISLLNINIINCPDDDPNSKLFLKGQS